MQRQTAQLFVRWRSQVHVQTRRYRLADDHDDLTARVVDEKKNEIKVRLAGIDAPEFSQDFGTKSKEALSEKVFGKKVTLESHGEDNFGRTLGTLKIGDRNINREMVVEGWIIKWELTLWEVMWRLYISHRSLEA